jgi:hypothetical protein
MGAKGATTMAIKVEIDDSGQIVVNLTLDRLGGYTMTQEEREQLIDDCSAVFLGRRARKTAGSENGKRRKARKATVASAAR